MLSSKMTNHSHPDPRTFLKAQKTFASHGMEEGKIETVIRLRGRKKWQTEDLVESMLFTFLHISHYDCQRHLGTHSIKYILCFLKTKHLKSADSLAQHGHWKVYVLTHWRSLGRCTVRPKQSLNLSNKLKFSGTLERFNQTEDEN